MALTFANYCLCEVSALNKPKLSDLNFRILPSERWVGDHILGLRFRFDSWLLALIPGRARSRWR
jgi:hypothetical protein